MSACSVERTAAEPDPLIEMLVAQCEQWQRCDCRSQADEPCEPYAQLRAAELRSQGAERGAALDEACAEAQRELAEALCRDGYGRPYTEELIALEAAADQCDLFHGDRSAGEPCEHPQDIPWGHYDDCDEGLLCLPSDAGALCGDIRRGRTDDLCFNVDVFYGCDVDLACVPISETQSECRPMMREGDACGGWQHDYCEGPPGLYCDQSSGRCRAMPDEGEPCIASDVASLRCQPDHECVDDVCRLRPAAGEPCMNYADCRRDLVCRDGLCSGDYGAC